MGIEAGARTRVSSKIWNKGRRCPPRMLAAWQIFSLSRYGFCNRGKSVGDFRSSGRRADRGQIQAQTLGVDPKNLTHNPTCPSGSNPL